MTGDSEFARNFPEIYEFFHGSNGFTFPTIFTYAYITLLIFTCLVSLSVPINRAMIYFRIVAFTFSILTMTSLFGMIAFVISSGLFPEEKTWNPTTESFDPTGRNPFSYLTLSGYLMIGMFFVPMILRPIDFL